MEWTFVTMVWASVAFGSVLQDLGFFAHVETALIFRHPHTQAAHDMLFHAFETRWHVHKRDHRAVEGC